jgi:2',3'-cyclic-nucleotide 2'-phosphodiesterase
VLTVFNTKAKMKIIFVGEIVAGSGRRAVQDVLPDLIKEFKPDLVLANAENLSGGRGITEEKLDQMIHTGVDYFTSGDHVYWERGTEDIIDKLPIIRPANYPDEAPGKGYAIIDLGKKGHVLLINLMGRTSVNSTFSYLDDPFKKLDTILKETEGKKLSAKIVDFHADYTSEKMAFAFYADGKVDAIIGTHTHVPTADTMVLPKGTIYVSDVGMCGIIDSVLGVKKEIIIDLFITARNQRFEWEKSGRKAFRSVLFDTDKKTIERYDKWIG